MDVINIRNVLGVLAHHYRVETMQISQPNCKEQELVDLLKGVIEGFRNSERETELITTVVYDSTSSIADVRTEEACPSVICSEPSSPEYKEPKEAKRSRVPFPYKQKAVAYWEGKRKKRSLDNVQKHYSCVTSAQQLYRWKRQISDYTEKQDQKTLASK